jgi:hypothetical protein
MQASVRRTGSTLHAYLLLINSIQRANCVLRWPADIFHAVCVFA